MSKIRQVTVMPRKKAAAKRVRVGVKKLAHHGWSYAGLKLPYKPAHLTVEQIEEAVDKLAA